MLRQDQKNFAARFPSAASFLLAAQLRDEYYALCQGGDRLNDWGKRRREELRHAPACNEAWFVLEVGRTFGQWPDGVAQGGE